MGGTHGEISGFESFLAEDCKWLDGGGGLIDQPAGRGGEGLARD